MCLCWHPLGLAACWETSRPICPTDCSLSLFLAAVPVPERSSAGRPGGTLVSHPLPRGITTPGTDQTWVQGAMLLGGLLGRGSESHPRAPWGGARGQPGCYPPQADRMGYEVLGPGAVLLCLDIPQAPMGSCSSLLYPHTDGDRICSTSGVKCRVRSLDWASPYPFLG